ncbi:MAG: cyclin family protein [bacterium]
MKKIYSLILTLFLLTSISIENAIAMKRRGKPSHATEIPKCRHKKALADEQAQTDLPNTAVTMVDTQTQTVESTKPAASAEQHPSKNPVHAQQLEVINTFVGPTSFADWIQTNGIINWLKMNGTNDCLIQILLTPQNILASVFEQTIKLMVTLTDDTGVIIESININNEPLKIRPFLGNGATSKETNPMLYLIRINKYCPCTPSYHVVALIYLQRLIKKNTPNIFNNISFYRTYIAAFILASKWLQDKVYTLTYYAQVSGIPKDELTSVEACFLKLIDFDIFVSPEEFKESFKQLIKLP